MSTRFQAGRLLDFESAAFKVVSGNASGTTPKVSGWIRVQNVDTIAWTFVTGASTNVVWTIHTSYDAKGSNPEELDYTSYLSTALPTGVNQNATVTMTVPPKAEYMRITATPSAGSGAVEASPGLIVGLPQQYSHCRYAAVHLYCPSSASLEGQAAIEFSANYNPPDTKEGLGNLPKTTGASGSNPERWFPACKHADDGGAAITIAALVASTGQDIPLRLGAFEYVALRAKFTPTGGFGRYQVTGNAKG